MLVHLACRSLNQIFEEPLVILTFVAYPSVFFLRLIVNRNGPWLSICSRLHANILTALLGSVVKIIGK